MIELDLLMNLSWLPSFHSCNRSSVNPIQSFSYLCKIATDCAAIQHVVYSVRVVSSCFDLVQTTPSFANAVLSSASPGSNLSVAGFTPT